MRKFELDRGRIDAKDGVCLRIAWAFLSCIKGFVRISTATGIAHAKYLPSVEFKKAAIHLGIDACLILL